MRNDRRIYRIRPVLAWQCLVWLQELAPRPVLARRFVCGPDGVEVVDLLPPNALELYRG